jgi:uncharacterized UPF0146 family protein
MRASDTGPSLVDRLAALADARAAQSGGDGPVVELAVGRRADVAAALADRGLEVLATDLRDRSTPDAVTFVRDDLTAPTVAHYADATLLFARNLPAELQGPAASLATRVDAPLYFTVLGAEEPIVPVERESVREGTLYRAIGGPGDGVTLPDG